MTKVRYPSDLTDEQWTLIAGFFTPQPVLGRPLAHERREIVNAILYQSRTGCQWRYLPNEFPPRSTVMALIEIPQVCSTTTGIRRATLGKFT